MGQLDNYRQAQEEILLSKFEIPWWRTRVESKISQIPPSQKPKEIQKLRNQ